LKDGTRSTYPVTGVRSASGAFAKTVAVVNKDPSPAVEVLHIVISGGVVVTRDPIELVVVKTTPDDRVEAGFVVIVLQLEDFAETTITSDR
jgi:hypothetical protein